MRRIRASALAVPRAALFVSLRLRLTLLTALLTGGTVLLFALAFYLVLRANLLGEIDARLQERASLVSATLESSANDRSGVERLVALAPLAEFDAPGIYVELIAPDGRVRATSPNLPAGYLANVSGLISTARAGATARSTVAAGGDEELRLLITPARVDDQAGGVLVVAESLELLQRTLAQARALLFVCGALALVLAIGGATLLTGQALRPISRLTQAAANVAATGHYQQRVPLPRHNDEVGQLAATINELIATVEQTLNQQRQFLADTSHELRSPLTVVLANLDLLRRDMERHERELSVREAAAEAQRMRRLVNDLLMLAQADSTLVIAHAPVQLDLLVEETVAMALRQAPNHRLEPQVDAPVVVMGDRERLTQLLRNLIENAFQHTPPGTAIVVRLRQNAGLVQLSVADNGPGIPPAHLARIWDRFYRVDKARSRTFGGSGLGLAIVKYLAEAHGGSAAVVSVAGGGTTFTICLPLAAEATQRSGQALPAPAVGGFQGRVPLP